MDYDKRIEIRYSAEQKERWREVAEAEGYESVSDWIRDTCDRRAAKKAAK